METIVVHSDSDGEDDVLLVNSPDSSDDDIVPLASEPSSASNSHPVTKRHLNWAEQRSVSHPTVKRRIQVTPVVGEEAQRRRYDWSLLDQHQEEPLENEYETGEDIEDEDDDDDEDDEYEVDDDDEEDPEESERGRAEASEIIAKRRLYEINNHINNRFYNWKTDPVQYKDYVEYLKLKSDKAESEIIWKEMEKRLKELPVEAVPAPDPFYNELLQKHQTQPLTYADGGDQNEILYISLFDVPYREQNEIQTLINSGTTEAAKYVQRIQRVGLLHQYRQNKQINKNDLKHMLVDAADCLISNLSKVGTTTFKTSQTQILEDLQYLIDVKNTPTFGGLLKESSP